MSNFSHAFINSTSLNITWSAPYTLEGVDILGYNISIINTSNDNSYFTQDTQYIISDIYGDPCTKVALAISGYNEAGDGATTSTMLYLFEGNIIM